MAAKKAAKEKQLEQEQMKLGKFDENGDEDQFEYTAIPPDGGFGWVIAFAAMLCNLVCDGTLFAFGAMKPYIQKHFNCSDMTILMVGSVPCGVYLLVGPIVSGLANRYGCRPIIIIGSIGAAACMALSTLSPTPTVMIIIYGIFGGVFFGMVYLPSVVMVSFYFDKKRTIANGLVTAGTGIGALSYAPLTNFLMSTYGWKIAMFILAAIMLSCILFGAIMKPLKPTKVPIKREIEMQSPVKDAQRPPESPTYRKTSGETSVPLLSGSHDAARPSNTATVPSDVPEVSMVGTSSSSSPPAMTSRARTSSAVSQTSSVGDQHRVGVPIAEDASRPFYKKDAFFTGSKKNLHHGSRTSLNNTNPYMSSVADISKAVKDEKKKDSAVRAFAEILAAMTDLSILKNKQILLICIGNIFSMLGYYLPIMCLISFANEDLKVPMDKASFLLTVFGIFNTLGRFSGGPIAMIPHLNVLRVHNGLLFTTGLLTIIAAYSFNFFTCALYAGLCGFALAPHMSLMPSIIYDCVGGDKFTTAFGILFLFRGFTSIIGPPAAGFVKDFTQSYSMAFAIGGAMIVIGAFFHMAISFFESEAERQARENDGNQKVEVDA